MLIFNENMHDTFLNKARRVFKKEYTVDLVMTSTSRKVVNVLEGAEYVTKENDVIIRGTVGEYWVTPLPKVISTYTKLDGTGLTPEDFRPDKSIKVKTKRGNYCYAMKVPVEHQMQVNTAWGDVLTANRDGVPHGSGDFVVCGEKDGNPDFSDVWIVNGKVFGTTYEVDKTYNPKNNSNENKAQNKKDIILKKARNPVLSHKSQIYNVNQLRPLEKSTLDKAVQNNTIILKFLMFDTVNDDAMEMSFSMKRIDNNKSMAYMIGGRPVIIKPIEERYKTLRGLVQALYSATRDGAALGDVDEEKKIFNSVVIMSDFSVGIEVRDTIIPILTASITDL